MTLDFQTLAGIQIAFILVGVAWFMWRNDEMPLLMSLIIGYFSSYRYWAVANGYGGWMDFTYFGFAPITLERALNALKIMVLGQATLSITYFLFQRSRIARTNSSLAPAVATKARRLVFILAIVIIPVAYRARQIVAAQIESGKNGGFEISSYLQQLPWGVVGIACLLILLWKFGALNQARYQLIAFLLLGTIFMISFGSTGRFLFVGWILAGTLAITSRYSPEFRLALMACLLGGGLLLFGAAGAPRDNPDALEDVASPAWHRIAAADDANMLDGFVFYQEVYPAQLPFSHGLHHLEILLRPIPRAYWPEKPVGGYLNKLGLITANDPTTVEICPSIFGSFYQEGQVPGMIALSILYGAILARLIVLSAKVHPFTGLLIRMVLAAWGSLVLRGGDLPGVYAWLATAFWPCAVVIWWLRKDLAVKAPQKSVSSRKTRSDGSQMQVPILPPKEASISAEFAPMTPQEIDADNGLIQPESETHSRDKN